MTRESENPPPGRPAPKAGDSGLSRDLTGQTLADFQVERLLGHGGMGEVYLARQVSLDRSVALKVLKPEIAANPTYMARFESEAWAAAKLNHPNIVHIYTLGGADRLKFIAMEYVPGTNLRLFLAKKGVPDLPLALAIMKQAAQAVGAAGDAGLVHRDIKPENLLLTRKGQVKVADFGLCRVHDSKQHLTQEGVTLGTPLYMSPEQVQGRPTDHRSDLYSLGVTFYHMLAGAPPFVGEAALAVALKHVNEKPVSLAVHRPDLPPEMVALVMRLLEKDPAMRYQHASEMLKDLAQINKNIAAASVEISTTQPGLSPADAAALDATHGATVTPARTPFWRSLRRSWNLPRLGRMAFLLGLPLALCAGAVWGWNNRTPDLVGSSAPQSNLLPGLWIEPWETTIPRYSTALEQYRFAQTRCEPARRVAAWLAVPGRFPSATEVTSRAYVQLIRDLLRRGDAERLAGLADEFNAANKRTGREVYVGFARMSRAAAAALRNEAGVVLEQMGTWPNIEYMDPALAEVGFEVVSVAGRSPSGAGSNAARLDKLRAGFLEPLQLPRPGLSAEGAAEQG